MSTPIGALRRRVSLERREDMFDGAGGMTSTYALLSEVFAAVEAKRRRTDVEGGREIGVVTHLVTIRFRDDLSGRVRIRDGGAIYRVLSTERADPQGRFLHLWCEEEQA
ncbi:MAG: phage head closure protein [Pseudomonadota bacterium]